MTACTLARLARSAASSRVIDVRFSSTSRAEAITRGSSAVASPRSTGRSAPSGSGGSVSTPLKARIAVPPTSPRTSVNTLLVRSQCASLRATSRMMRTSPVGPSSTLRTRPIGKPEKVMSMPTDTPSESSVVSTRVWVGSKKPRAYSR